MIVAFEGIDASGKQSQAEFLTEKLEAKGIPTTLMSFPRYDFGVGNIIRDLLKGRWEVKALDTKYSENTLRAVVVQALQTVNRLEYFEFLGLWKRHPQGVLVLDRYYASGLAYGAADGLDTGWLEKIHSAMPRPDLWLFLDVPAELSVKRRPVREDEYETREGFMHAVRRNYQDLAKDDTWRTIDGTKTQREVASEVWDAVRPLVEGR